MKNKHNGNYILPASNSVGQTQDFSHFLVFLLIFLFIPVGGEPL